MYDNALVVRPLLNAKTNKFSGMFSNHIFVKCKNKRTGEKFIAGKPIVYWNYNDEYRPLSEAPKCIEDFADFNEKDWVFKRDTSMYRYDSEKIMQNAFYSRELFK